MGRLFIPAKSVSRNQRGMRGCILSEEEEGVCSDEGRARGWGRAADTRLVSFVLEVKWKELNWLLALTICHNSWWCPDLKGNRKEKRVERHRSSENSPTNFKLWLPLIIWSSLCYPDVPVWSHLLLFNQLLIFRLLNGDGTAFWSLVSPSQRGGRSGLAEDKEKTAK